MLSVKQAVESAAAFAKGVFEPERLVDLRLEEVETGNLEGKDAWVITLSARDPEMGLTSFMPQGPRSYKRFFVSKESGEVLSMKIREMAGV
jgi:hypothetical protein